MKLLGIERSSRFSPNSTARDKAIFNAVADELRRMGHLVDTASEDNATAFAGYESVFNMGRDECFLHRLAEEEIKGLRVINSASALLSSTRSVLTRLFEEKKIPTPESRTLTLAQLREYASHPISSGCFSSGSLWIKRGDACAQQATDVCFIRNKEELQTAYDFFLAHNIDDIVISEHIPGDLVKFYGVEGTDFFFYHYPTATGTFSKFGLEVFNGVPAGYDFSPEELKKTADRAARLSGFIVYGGDCIIRPDGTFAIIDFNDWPSFSLCRTEAAQAIATRIGKTL